MLMFVVGNVLLTFLILILPQHILHRWEYGLTQDKWKAFGIAFTTITETRYCGTCYKYQIKTTKEPYEGIYWYDSNELLMKDILD